jgi:hypothetical protein
MATVKNQIYLRGDALRIFDLVTTAKYWTQWHPATLGVSGQIENPMSLGDVIRERAKIGQAIGENDWTVTEWERPNKVVLSMPATRLGDLKITYFFTPHKDGVEYTRELEYDASGFPSEVAKSIEQQMNSDSAEALKRIKALVEQQV